MERRWLHEVAPTVTEQCELRSEEHPSKIGFGIAVPTPLLSGERSPPSLKVVVDPDNPNHGAMAGLDVSAWLGVIRRLVAKVLPESTDRMTNQAIGQT